MLAVYMMSNAKRRPIPEDRCQRCRHACRSRSWLLLLLLPESHKTDTRDLDDLESHTRNITLGLALSTESCNQHLIVLIHEVQATVVWYCGRWSAVAIIIMASPRHTECGDLLSVLDELNTNTLSNGRVWLLGLNTDLF